MHLLIILPAAKAPMAFPTGAGSICRAETEFEAFSVRAKYVAIFETSYIEDQHNPLLSCQTHAELCYEEQCLDSIVGSNSLLGDQRW